ncbi:MAG: S8 family serine peptidase [Planctomycetes bacterium]|nr:S8 family serine peptidase [Planctomycetota bacterium]
MVSDNQVTASPTTLIFTPANWNVPQTVSVSAADDTMAEGSHNGVIHHSAASGDGRYDGLAIRDVVVAITDNDAASGSISGHKFHDLDQDRVWDANEPALEGWTIYLDQNRNGQLDPGEMATTTDAQGEYRFSGLQPGTYVVAEVMQTGWVQTYPGSGGSSLLTTSGQSVIALTTTASSALVNLIGEVEPVESANSVTPSLVESSDLINMQRFRADPRFAGIDGRGLSAVIIDGGIDRDHPFFGPDNNGDGTADRIVYQYDFADNDTDASDRDGHGSNVSSIVGSQDGQYTGMAPGSNLIALKVFTDSGTGNFAYLEKALQWVVANAQRYNIVSVNMSLGDSTNRSSPQTDYGIGDELAALAAQNVIVVSASGNDYARFNSPGVAYPAADPNSLSVGAVYDANVGSPFYPKTGAWAFTTGPDRITPFSQRHANMTTVFAPGAEITGANWNGGILTERGTSQAAPHVAGAAVLANQLALQTLGRLLTTAEFRQLLAATGVSINDGDDEDDNVANTNLDFRRLDVLALAEGILAMRPSGTHTVILGPGEAATGKDFGNARIATGMAHPSVTDPGIWVTTGDEVASFNPAWSDGHVSSGRTTLTLKSDAPRDVSLQADVVLGVNQVAGLIARYRGAGDRNYYVAQLKRTSTGFIAQVFKNVNGAFTQLATTKLVSATGDAHLRFLVTGINLKFFVNGRQVADILDRSFRSGSVGIRSSQLATLDNFHTVAMTVELPFSDTFTQPSGAALNTNWTRRSGNFTVSGEKAIGVSTFPVVNLATLVGVAQANVEVQANLSLITINHEIGLLARYSGVGDTNYYMARVRKTASGYNLSIIKNVGGIATTLKSLNVKTLTGTIKFRVEDAGLTLFMNNVQQLAVIDRSLTIGSVGMRSIGSGQIDNFSATARVPSA